MARTWHLLPVLALLNWAVPAEARRLPDRGQVERAVNAWHGCRAGRDCAGVPAPHRRLTRSRCFRLPRDDTYPGRILCTFSGIQDIAGRPAAPFRGECAYLMPTGRGWEVSAIPDADMCE